MTDPKQQVHIVAWQRYLHYVRGGKISSPHWRPGQINIFLSEFSAKIYELSDADIGRFMKLLVEYAESPLIDPSTGPLGPRKLPRTRAEQVVKGPGMSGESALERLVQADLVALGPSGVVELSSAPLSSELEELLNL